jgi:hypothetical protein
LGGLVTQRLYLCKSDIYYKYNEGFYEAKHVVMRCNIYGVICVISLSLLKYNGFMVMYNLIKFYTGNCKLHVVLYQELVVSIRVGVTPHT